MEGRKRTVLDRTEEMTRRTKLIEEEINERTE
jgi:hypothetical protein